MQLDLFSPNDMFELLTEHPKCFESRKQYSEWLDLARVVKEQASICDDCTKSHKAKMMEQKRCQTKWETIYVGRPPQRKK